MLLSDVMQEFLFNCQCRKLSERTVNNYKKQIGYLLRFLSEKQIIEIENVKPVMIKNFLMDIRKKNRTTNYQNDLLKAFKVYFKYAFNEGYTESLLTEKISNAKGEKTIIRTFSDTELKKMLKFYDKKNDFLNTRNQVVMCLLIDTGIRLLLFEYLINTYSNENDIVLDPFMGSGTTAICCINLNRNYLGFELDSDYYEKLTKRINSHKRQDNNYTNK